MQAFKDVFEDELKDLYSAERQLVQALPKMARGAVNDQLRQAFERHLEQTRTHVDRLEQVAKVCDISLRGKRCKAMEGLVEEGSELLSEEDKGPLRDVALIPAAQRVEHYEIAAYGSVAMFAELLGYTKAKQLLGQTLEEEKAADLLLTQIAERSVNPTAMQNATEAASAPNSRSTRTSASSTSRSKPASGRARTTSNGKTGSGRSSTSSARGSAGRSTSRAKSASGKTTRR